MTARALLVAFSCAVALAGCRQLVEPDAVSRIGAARTIHGTIGPLDGYADEPGWFTLRPVRDDGAFGQPITAGPVEVDGSFQALVPRGTDGRGSVEVEWLVDDAPRAHVFGPVPLAGRAITLDYAPRRITGRVVWPEGFTLAPEQTALIEFESVVEFPPSAVFYNDSFVAAGADGLFELVVPDRAWRVDLFVRDAGGLDQLSIDYGFPPIGDPFELEVPIVPVRLRVEAPSGLVPGSRVVLAVRSGFFDRTERIETRWTGAAEDGEFATWRPAEPEPYAIRVETEDGDRPIRLLDDRPRPAFDEVPAGGTVTLDLGECLVRVLVRRDGLPVENAQIEVPWFGDENQARTRSEGIADYLVPATGPVVVIVADGDQRVVREVDVSGYTEVVVDLDPIAPLDD